MCPTPQASVDVRLVLESIKARDLQKGSWVNVIGYVRKPEQRQKKTNSPNTNDIKKAALALVQAILVWGAGAIKVADYEAALISFRDVKRGADFYTAT